jgi:hypothetical protein
MNVAAWLHGLGLGHYEQGFGENDIDAAVLARLTADSKNSACATGSIGRTSVAVPLAQALCASGFS